MTADNDSSPSSLNTGLNRRAAELLESIEYRRMETPDQLEDVFRLRYDAYRREQFIEENAEKHCTDPLDKTPNNTIFGVYLHGKLLSSLRIHVLNRTQRESPSNLVFGDKVDPMLDAGKIIIDPSRFVADQAVSRKYRALPYLTLRLAGMATLYYEADHCLSLVRPEHAAFYKKIYRSEKIGEERRFPSINFPVELYCADAKAIRVDVGQRYPFLKATPSELRQVFSTERELTPA